MTEQDLTALAKDCVAWAKKNGLQDDSAVLGEWALALKAERDALQAQLEDERIWRRDAERVAAGGKCSCWLGRPGATFGSSTERQACAVHRDTEVVE